MRVIADKSQEQRESAENERSILAINASKQRRIQSPIEYLHEIDLNFGLINGQNKRHKTAILRADNLIRRIIGPIMR